MKTIIMLFFAAIVVLPSSLFAQSKAGKVDTMQHTTFYSCPNHPEVHTIKAGVCQQCGMKLNLTTKEQMKAVNSNTYQCPIHLDIKGEKPGTCPKCGVSMNLSTKEKMLMGMSPNFKCPMHPDVKAEKSGKCPKCGMSLTEIEPKKNDSLNHKH
jgi:uncharacterized paraquat-inducible protein A